MNWKEEEFLSKFQKIQDEEEEEEEIVAWKSRGRGRDHGGFKGRGGERRGDKTNLEEEWR